MFSVALPIVWPVAIFGALGLGILQQHQIPIVRTARNWPWTTLGGALIGQAAAWAALVFYSPYKGLFSKPNKIEPMLMGLSFSLAIVAAQLLHVRRMKGGPRVVGYLALSYVLAACGAAFNSYSLGSSLLFILAIYWILLSSDAV